jgi:DNA-binding winged helix-turn-helix (wHTH) protein
MPFIPRSKRAMKLNTIVLVEENEATQRALGDLLHRGSSKTLSVNEADHVLDEVCLHGACVVVIGSQFADKGEERCDRIGTLEFRTPDVLIRPGVKPFEEPLLPEEVVDGYVANPSGERAGMAQSRCVPHPSASRLENTICFGDIEIDVDRPYVKRSGHTLKMTRSEYNLLLFFINNVDQSITRDIILNEVWGYECYPTTRTVDAHIVKLRKKLEPDPHLPRHLLTVHGVGYRFVMFPATIPTPEDTRVRGEALSQAGVCVTHMS